MENTIRGIVKDGVIVPEVSLPEGLNVEIRILPIEMPPEWQAEFDAWDRASAAALDLVERLLEDEERDEAP